MPGLLETGGCFQDSMMPPVSCIKLVCNNENPQGLKYFKLKFSGKAGESNVCLII